MRTRPPVPSMRPVLAMRPVPRRGRVWLVTLAAAATLMTACSGSGDEAPGSAGSTTTSTASTPTPAAEPPAAPEVGACYQLRFGSALAPTSDVAAKPCAREHTSQTYAVGTLETVVDGHLLAVDARRVQDQVASACPETLSDFVGGDADALRLSMIRPVWFTPTVEQSDTGADWYRCDAVVVQSSSALVRRTGSLEGVLDRPAEREAVAMCGTAAPDSADFTRVPCGDAHSWRALEVVAFPDGDYPGADAARERGQTQCEDVAGARAEDPLDFEWGYEWPTREQWASGQTYGRCWAPD